MNYFSCFSWWKESQEQREDTLPITSFQICCKWSNVLKFFVGDLRSLLDLKMIVTPDSGDVCTNLKISFKGSFSELHSNITHQQKHGENNRKIPHIFKIFTPNLFDNNKTSKCISASLWYCLTVPWLCWHKLHKTCNQTEGSRVTELQHSVYSLVSCIVRDAQKTAWTC